jgi:tetratricopeptide (TPR) repeat protein
MKKIIIILLMNIIAFNAVAEVNSFNEGKKLFLNKKYEEAKIYFEKDIVFNPKNEESYLYLAKIFKENGKIELEENNLETVILIDPKNEEGIHQLILLNIKKSNYSKSKELINNFASICKKMCSSKSDLEEKLNSASKK